MSAGKYLLVLGAAVGVGLLVLNSKNANASTGAGAGGAPVPGPGAQIDHIGAGIGPGIPALKRATWSVAADASGQQQGKFVLTQAENNPADWVLVFVNASNGGAGIVAVGNTQMSGLMAQEMAAGF